MEESHFHIHDKASKAVKVSYNNIDIEKAEQLLNEIELDSKVVVAYLINYMMCKLKYILLGT